jgi:hypothetical protein
LTASDCHDVIEIARGDVAHERLGTDSTLSHA